MTLPSLIVNFSERTFSHVHRFTQLLVRFFGLWKKKNFVFEMWNNRLRIHKCVSSSHHCEIEAFWLCRFRVCWDRCHTCILRYSWCNRHICLILSNEMHQSARCQMSIGSLCGRSFSWITEQWTFEKRWNETYINLVIWPNGTKHIFFVICRGWFRDNRRFRRVFGFVSHCFVDFSVESQFFLFLSFVRSRKRTFFRRLRHVHCRWLQRREYIRFRLICFIWWLNILYLCNLFFRPHRCVETKTDSKTNVSFWFPWNGNDLTARHVAFPK